MGLCCSTEDKYSNQDYAKAPLQTKNKHYSSASILKLSNDQAIYDHPICFRDGLRAFEIHTFFEEALGITFFHESKKFKQHLSLIQPLTQHQTRPYHKKLTAITVHQYLQENEPYKTDKSTITLLLKKMEKTLKDIFQKKPTFYNDKEEVLVEIWLLTLMNLPQDPKSFKIFHLDDPSPEHLKNAFQKLDYRELELILTPIFTSFANMRVKPFFDCDDLTIISEVLSTILAVDPRAIEIFVNHQNFLPEPNIKNGNSSVFGALLAITSFPDEFGIQYDLQDADTCEIRGLYDNIIEVVYQEMLALITTDPKYEQNIAKWFASMLQFFEQKLKNKDDLSSMKSYKGLFFNYLALLFKFLEDPLTDFDSYLDVINQIDLKYIQNFPLAANQPLLNGMTYQIQKEQDTMNYSFQTQLIFFAVYAIGQYEEFVGQFLQSHKDMFNLISLGPITLMSSDDPQAFGFKLQALDERLLTQLYNLISLQVMLILHSFDVNLENYGPYRNYFDQTDSLQSSNFENQPSLPVSCLESMINCLCFLRKANSIISMGSDDRCGLIVCFLASIIQNKEWISPPHIRAQSLSLLTSLVPSEMTFSLPIYQSIFRFFATNNTLLFTAIIRFFVDCKESSNELSNRVNLCILLACLLKEKARSENNQYTSTIFEDLTRNEKELCQKFAMIYLNDLMQFFEPLKKINQIIELEQRQEASQQLDFLELLVLMMDKDAVKSSSELIQCYLSLGIIMTKFSVPFFLSDETKDKLALTLNYMLSGFFGKNAELDVTKSHQGLRYHPDLLVTKILILYLNFSHKAEFLLEVISDDQNFSLDLFLKTTEAIGHLTLLEPEQLEEFKEFGENLKQKVQEKENEERLIGSVEDIPEEYLDSLMNTLMKEPVMLPLSKVILDKRTICKHLLINSNDPFNRSHLTIDMLIPQPELKQKIQEFIQQKKVSI